MVCLSLELQKLKIVYINKGFIVWKLILSVALLGD